MKSHGNKTVSNLDPSFQAHYLEPASGDESLGAQASPGLDTCFRVRVITRGRRLGDVDGRSCKAVFDAFTKARVWPDDSFKFIKEVSFAQELGEEDQTVIEVWRI